MAGWIGKALRVNLSSGTIQAEDIPRQWLEDYVGGRGLADRYLFQEMDPTVDALAPENKLIFATGPLTGTPAPCGARYMVVTKGALTGAITTSNSGGHWGPELKFAGYDLVILEGAAPRPSYLFIYDDHVEIRDAAAYWGKTVSQTEDGLRKDLGIPQLRIACIGPAGENRVRFACIINDKHRAAGRSGVGAVMGSKNLKAIAVRGTGGVEIAEPTAFMQELWKLRPEMAASVVRQNFTELGTLEVMEVVNAFGGLPTRNATSGQFEGVEHIDGNTFKDTRMVANKACFACTIACGRVCRLGDEADQFMVNMHRRNWKTAVEGPEYETAWAFGPDCGVDERDAILMGNWLCNDLGMDPISMGATLAAAMELYQKGVITDAQVEIPLAFGSGQALVRMVEATAYREGFGDELAEGSKRMTEKFQHPELFIGSKGQEFPAYDPRGFQAMGLGYATCNRGACHIRAWSIAYEASGQVDPYTPVGKAAWVSHEQNETTVTDNTGVCIFGRASGENVTYLASLTAAATGVPYNYAAFVKIGERTWNLERLWNLQAGFTAADDTIPKRHRETAFTAGPSKGVTVQLDVMLPEYYNGRGWNEAGVPSQEKLTELGLASLQ